MVLLLGTDEEESKVCTLTFQPRIGGDDGAGGHDGGDDGGGDDGAGGDGGDGDVDGGHDGGDGGGCDDGDTNNFNCLSSCYTLDTRVLCAPHSQSRKVKVCPTM